MYSISELKKTWREPLLDKNFRARFLYSFVSLAIILLLLARFLAYNETREGFALGDPLLSAFRPVDVTWLTFGLIYAALLIALFSLSFHPESLLIALQAYAFMALFRMATIYFLPLNAPAEIIPLKDPFVEIFGGGKTLLRDLFFSGHTATMFLFFLTAESKMLKKVFLVCTVLVGAAVLIQHVHYTVDVIAAPFFAYTCYRIALSLKPAEVK